MTSDSFPLPTHLVPLPPILEIVGAHVREWANSKPTVCRVFLYGSTLGLKPNPHDLDLAVQYVMADYQDVLNALMDDLEPWQRQLSELLAFPVHLEVAHPEVSDTVWSYLCEGCAILYER